MVVVEKVGEGITDAEGQFQNAVLAGCQDRDPFGVPGSRRILPGETIAVDRRRRETDRTRRAAEARGCLEDKTGAETVRRKGNALRSHAVFVAEDRETPTAISRDVDFPRTNAIGLIPAIFNSPSVSSSFSSVIAVANQLTPAAVIKTALA